MIRFLYLLFLVLLVSCGEGLYLAGELVTSAKISQSEAPTNQPATRTVVISADSVAPTNHPRTITISAVEGSDLSGSISLNVTGSAVLGSTTVTFVNGVAETTIENSVNESVTLSLSCTQPYLICTSTKTISFITPDPLEFKFSSVTLTHSNPDSKYTFIAQGGFGEIEYSVVSGPGSIDAKTGEYTAGNTAGDAVIRATDSIGNTVDALASNILNLTNGSVTQQVLDSTGSLYLAGSFTQIYPQKLSNATAIDASSGKVELGFDTKAGFDGSVRAAVALPDGSVIVGGAFTSYNGVSRGRIAKLSPSGELNLAFATGSGFVGGLGVNSLAISPDGQSVYVGGGFTTYDGVTRQRVAKLSVDTGALDLTFDSSSGFNNYVYTLEVSPDGSSLYAGGQFTTYGGVARQRVAKLNTTNGALDLTFDASVGFDNTVYSLALSVDGGSIFAGGQFLTYNGTSRVRIAKLNASSAALDVTFDSSIGSVGTVFQILKSSDGNSIYAGGQILSYNGTPRNNLAKISAIDATLDLTFVPSGLYQIYSMTFATDQESLLVGMSSSYGVKKVDAQTGLTNSSFAQGDAISSSGSVYIYTLALLSNDLIFTGGSFNSLNNGVSCQNLAKLNSDATVNSDFNTSSGLSSSPAKIKLSNDESHLYVATSGTYKGTAYSDLLKINTTDASLNFDFDATGFLGGDISDFEISNDGLSIYLAGGFTTYQGIARNKLAKIDSEFAVLDMSFDPLASVDTTISSIKLSQDQSSLFLGGSFTTYQGTARQRIAKISATNANLDATFDASIAFNNTVNDFIVSNDGLSLYAVGSFTSFNGTTRNKVAKISSTDATLDMTFDTITGFNNSPTSIVQSTLGELYVGYSGAFTYKGSNRYGVVKINSTNANLDATFDTSTLTIARPFKLSNDESFLYYGGDYFLDATTGALLF